MISYNLENKEIINQTCKVVTYISPKQENINSNSQTFDSFMSFVPSETNFPFKLEEQMPKLPIFIKNTKEILFVRVISYIRLTLKHIER